MAQAYDSTRGRRDRKARSWRAGARPVGLTHPPNTLHSYITFYGLDAEYADMGISAFMDRSYRIAPDGRSVVCYAVVGRDENESLSEALAWRREEIGRSGLEQVSAILELRALMTLDDLLAAMREVGPEATLTLTRDQGSLLCQITGAYVTERDTDSYQPPEERDRIATLQALVDPLFDLVAELDRADEVLRAQSR
jgi:hypothetical protein